jgi:RNA polymerase sigma-70 factor (ECF subfamily)
MLNKRQKELGRTRPMTEELEDTLRHPGEETDDLALAGMTAEYLIAAIGHLPDDKAEIIRMSALDGLSDKQIAGMLGITPGSARSRLSRARAQLKAMLLGEVYEED